MSEFTVGTQLILSTKSFLLGIGVLGASAIAGPPFFIVAWLAYSIGIAVYNERRPIFDGVYQDRYGTAAMAKLRNTRISQQLSPDLQIESKKVLNSMQTHDIHLHSSPQNTYLPTSHNILKAAHRAVEVFYPPNVEKIPIKVQEKAGSKDKNPLSKKSKSHDHTRPTDPASKNTKKRGG